MFRTASAEINRPRARRSLLVQSDRSALVVPLLLFCIAYVFLILLITLFNGGQFMYTLDDPYIHLALAENIAQGHYGVNLNELSAPSSSILWPLLLTPVAGAAYGYLVPLALNLFASLGALVMFHMVIGEALAGVAHEKKNEVVATLLVGLALATNMLGLAFTGMEHSLQLFFAAAVVAGFIQERKQRRAPWWFACALVLGPLVRYENLCLSAPALIYLLWRKQYRVALACGALLAAALGGFSLFLYASGLGVLPTSILAKTNLASDTGGASSILGNLLSNLLDRQGALLLVGILVLLIHKRPEHRPIALWAIAATSLHFALGKFGWYGRYEIYIWATMLLVLIHIYGESLWQIIFAGSDRRAALMVAALILVLGAPYLYTLATTPIASSNIYQQQYQMHRFAVDYYKAPVAVNDLGWVSYQNDAYVLDLGGLASREALELRRGKTSDWMDRIARERGVKFAMIYDSWFKGTPPSWIPVGKLYLGRAAITAADSVVTFYALDQATAQQVAPLLRAFQASVPAGARFVIQGESP